MYSKKSLFLIVMAQFFMITARGGEIADLYLVALKHAHKIEIVKSQVIGSEGSLIETRAGFRPQIAGQIQADATSTYTNAAFPSRNTLSKDVGAGLTATKVIYNPVLSSSVREANLAVDKSTMSYDSASQTFISWFVQSYLTLMKLNAQRLLAKTEILAIEKYIKQFKEIAPPAQGPTNKAIPQIVSSLSQTEKQLIREHETISSQLRMGRQIFAQYVERDVRLPDVTCNLELPVPDHSLEDWIRIARETNPQVKLGEMDVKIAEEHGKQLTLASRPTVALQGSYGYGGVFDMQMGRQQKGNAAIGFAVKIPLFQGSSNTNKAQIVKAKVEEAKQNVEQSLEDIKVQVINAFGAMKLAKSQIAELESDIKQSNQAYVNMLNGKSDGTLTPLELFGFYQQIYGLNKQLTEVNFQYLAAVLTLKLAAGTISVSDLGDLDSAVEKAVAFEKERGSSLPTISLMGR